ncbi:MAG: class I SAM-dependent methyltransferase [Nitrospirota bacterium]|nr:class I SAM-dependent methyltransferase [Nitrospirota bacterium]
MNCRHCRTPLEHVFLDLGFAPPSNAYRKEEDLTKPELYFPLKLYVCDHCWLVQTEDYVHADELFSSDYAYFSSVSQIWCDHATRYVEMITERLSLGQESFVIEIASNDGYLLKNFVARDIHCLGIEPTTSTAEAAEKIGVPVLRRFFGKQLALELADEGKQADLIIGNNVYAHVPDINDFTAGLKAALKPGGTITLEFPHLMRLIEDVQFDTVYHEHYSYLSLSTVDRIFAAAGLRIFDVEELLTHGGSLRVYGCHADDTRPCEEAVSALLAEEQSQGMQNLLTYRGFQAKADRVKDNLLGFLIDQKKKRKKVAAYGAAAKGNTLLNYAGVKKDLLPYVCDAALSKQGKFLPGSHIPILHPPVLKERKPDVLLILPWNIAQEVMQENAFIREWDGKFVTAVPSLRVI